MTREIAEINLDRFPMWIKEYRLWANQERAANLPKRAKAWDRRADELESALIGIASI